jgi:hypothetical protein
VLTQEITHFWPNVLRVLRHVFGGQLKSTTRETEHKRKKKLNTFREWSCRLYSLGRPSSMVPYMIH